MTLLDDDLAAYTKASPQTASESPGMTSTQARRRIERLQLRREQLRDASSSSGKLEANRVRLATAERQLNQAMLAEHGHQPDTP